MRLASAVLLAASLAVTPVWAQDAPAAPAEPAAPAAPTEPAPAAPAEPLPEVTAAEVGPNVDRDFWCAVAFSLTARAAEMNGDGAGAGAEAQKSQILFAGIVTLMQAANFQEQQFNAMTTKYTARVLDPFAAPESGFTREVCEAAVPEAQAAVEAAQAAAAAAEPGAPAEPATPDAPAADAPPADAPGTSQ